MRPPEKACEPLKRNSRQSRRIIISVSFLFLLIHLPVRSQGPTPSQKPHWPIPRKGLHVFLTPTPTKSPVNSTLSLKPEKETAQIGEWVKFTATFTPVRREVIYHFDGDGATITGGGVDQPAATGQFSTPGLHVVYVHAFIRGTTLSASTNIQVNEAEPTVSAPKVAHPAPNLSGPLDIQLLPSNVHARVGVPVTFTVLTNLPPKGRLEFHPDDRSKATFVKRGEFKYTYFYPGSYTASVTLAGSKPSNLVTVFVDSSIPWKYVIPIGLLVAIAGYLLYKILKRLFARPTFHPYWDHATPQKPPDNTAINYELHFDPNLSQGSHQLKTNEANLIISRKKET